MEDSRGRVSWNFMLKSTGNLGSQLYKINILMVGTILNEMPRKCIML